MRSIKYITVLVIAIMFSMVAFANSEKRMSLPNTPAARHLQPPSAKAHHVKHTWNLRGADIRTVIQEVARETGKNFLIDPRVEGKISIVSTKPMEPDQLYQVFLSMLEISGFAALQEGNIIKIVPTLDAKMQNPNVYGAHTPKNGDEVVVQVVPIQYVSAQQLVPILRPLMPQWTSLSAYIPSNSLILSGRASNLGRLINIVQRVDVPNNTTVQVIPLHNGIAAEVVKTLTELQQKQQSLGINPVALSSDDRANAIIISGTPAQRLRMRVLISQLDTSNPASLNDSTQVIYLQYMQAKDLAPILAGVARSHFRGDVGVTIGSKTQEKPTALAKNGGTESTEDETASSRTDDANQNQQASNTVVKTQDSAKPRVEIIAEPNTNSIILNGPPSLMLTLKTVIAKLDIRPMQVAVEALIAEINEDDVTNLGIDWGSRDRAGGGFGSLGPFNSGFGVIRRGGFSNFELQLHALTTNDKADIISTPSVVVLDNHLAHIRVGKEVSVKESDYPGNANGTTTATPYNTFKRVPVALVLNVTPQITHDGAIKLLISHQNNTLQNPGLTVDNPIFNISEISTSVLVSNGDILVLGGLIQNQLRDEDSSIPILGEFPGIGKIFHHSNKTHFKKKLMVFLRPFILLNKDNIQVTGSKYEDIRDSELDDIRQRGYSTDYKEYVLPDYQTPLKLPLPFIHQHS